MHRRYAGADIVFPDGRDVRLSPADNPYLAAKAGDDIITASGTTPLGADDKAGIAIIMTMAKHLLAETAATLHFIPRDFELNGLRRHGELVQQVCATVQAMEPRARISRTITPQCRNMRYWLETDMRPVDLAREACRQIGIEPTSDPMRAGTDGSRLTELGVPTPNCLRACRTFTARSSGSACRTGVVRPRCASSSWRPRVAPAKLMPSRAAAREPCSL